MNQKATTHPNPFVGPRSFTVDQAQWFKGRDREANELLSLLLARRLTLFYSQSGAGKTSLLNARLIPMLQAEQFGFEVLPVGRIGDAISPPEAVDESFNIFVFNLAVSLEVTDDPEQLAGLRCTDFLLDIVHDGQQFRYVGGEETKTAVEANETESVEEENHLPLRPRALLIDQFEEIFTVHPDRERERVAFFSQISEAMEQDPYLYVLFSMRGDYIDRLSPYVKLLPDSLRTRYYMERMREDAALQAVRLPVQEAGRPFADDVSEKLVRYLRGSDLYVETVQLQVVCLQLWQSLANIPGDTITMDNVVQVASGFTNQGQEEISDTQETVDPLATFINNALASYYQQAIEAVLNHPDVSIAEHELRHWFSTKLITASGTRNLLARGETDTGGMAEIVVELLDRAHYLVRNDIRGGRPFIELVHDSFIEPIRRANRQWERDRTREITWLAAALRYYKTQDVTLLLKGDQLASAQNQAAAIQGLPTEAETYLKASESNWQREREELQQREMQQQRALTEAERRRANEAEVAKARQRWLLVLALVIGGIALFFAIQTKSQTVLAEEQAQLAIEETTRTAEQAAKAATVQAELNSVEATRAADALAAEAENAAAAARERERLVSLIDSLSLAGKVESFLNRSNINAALLLSRMAAGNSGDEAAIQGILLQALNNATDRNAHPNYRPADAAAALAFRHELTLTGLPIDVSKPLLAGPEAGTLAAINHDEIAWWRFEAPEPVHSSITLAAPVETFAFTSLTLRPLLAVGSGSTLTLWQEGNQGWRQTDVRELGSGDLQKIAFNQAGNQLAAAMCDATGRCFIYKWQIIDGQLQELKTERIALQDEIVALLFIGDVLVWSTPDEIDSSILSEKPVFQLPPPEPGYSRQAIALIERENWLVVGGSCTNEVQCGYIRYWSLGDGIWLTPPLRQPAPVTQLVYDEMSESLIAALSRESGLSLLAWETRLERWQELACAIAGRNLTFAEWREVFPGQDVKDYPLICTDFPRHISVANGLVAEAEQSLAECSDNRTVEARIRYQEAQAQASFETWAVPILLETALERGNVELATECADQASELSQEFKAGLFLQIRRNVQDTSNSELFNLAQYNNQRQELASYELAAALLDQYVANSVYQTPCFTSSLPKAVEACTSYNQLLQQSGLLDDFIPLTPTERSDTLHKWRFNGNVSDLVTINFDAPENEYYVSLALYNSNGEQIGFNEGTQAVALNVLLPEDDTYTVEVSGDGGSELGEYSLSAESVTATEIMVGTTNVTAEAGQQLWQFSANQGDYVTINLEAPGSENDSFLTLYGPSGGQTGNGQGYETALLEALLPEDGIYTLAVRWADDPSSYALSVEADTPTILTEGTSSITAEADQELWQFNASQGEWITVNLEAAEAGSIPYLYLFDQNGRDIGQYTDSSGLSTAEGVLLEDGFYTIVVRWGSEPSSYTLSVEAITPTVIEPGSTNVIGEIEQRLWQFNAGQGDFVTINLEATGSDSYPMMTVYGPSGGQVGYGEGYESASLNALLPEDGTYAIDVRWSSDPSSYILSVETETSLFITGNSFSQEAGAEQRWWQFVGERGTQVVITMETLEPDGDPYLRLYDATGFEISSNDDSGETRDSRIEFVLPADGLYQIEADWFANPGRYRLTFTR